MHPVDAHFATNYYLVSLRTSFGLVFVLHMTVVYLMWRYNATEPAFEVGSVPIALALDSTFEASNKPTPSKAAGAKVHKMPEENRPLMQQTALAPTPFAQIQPVTSSQVLAFQQPETYRQQTAEHALQEKYTLKQADTMDATIAHQARESGANSQQSQQQLIATQVKNASNVSQPIYSAKYLNNPMPMYPAISKAKGEQGTVQFKVLVDEQGMPIDIVLHQTSHYPRLDQGAASAIKSWKFIPAKNAGVALQAWVIVPITFTLKDI